MKAQRTFQQQGEHAGTGVYQPRDRRGLKVELVGAIGRTVDLNFAGVADFDERYPGQNLYQERGARHILQSTWIPEEDVRFSSRPGNGPSSPHSNRKSWMKRIVVAAGAMARVFGLSSWAIRQ